MKTFFYFLVLAFVAPLCASAADLSDEEFNKLMERYLSNKQNVKKMLESIQTHASELQAEQQKKEAEARAQQLEDQFKNPVKVDIGSSPVRGNEAAKVTIVEFSDFQCPYCQRGAQVMEQVLKDYPNDVKVVFKNLPLEFHPEAKPAAVAALAAGEQGKFWEMHDELFGNQQGLGDGLYLELAKKLGLDIEKFKIDIGRADLAKKVDEDMALATSLGVEGTPGFFVNGVRVEGAQPPQFFKKLIDRWLSQK